MSGQMQKLTGIPVSPGVAIGPAFVLGGAGPAVPPRRIRPEDVAAELKRLERAIQASIAEVQAEQERVRARLGEETGAIFQAHVQMLQDPGLLNRVRSLIENEHFAAEYAVYHTIQRYISILQELKTPIGARASDLRDICEQLLRHLTGRRRQELRRLSTPSIVIAQDLTPAETASLDTSRVLAFATELGSRTSHTAIVAGGLDIPAVVGVAHLMEHVYQGATVIVDGNRGTVIVDPDPETLRRYEYLARRFQFFAQTLSTLRGLPAVTKDEHRIYLMGNIEFPREVEYCLRQGADGIGLYRTEFLFLERDTIPSEEEHLAAYSKVIRAMRGRPVVIRTLDLGADKLPDSMQSAQERNPFLGLRSIRLCLRRTDLFKTQLRAILRASVEGPVHLMFPMVSTLAELRRAKLLLAEVREDLSDEGVPYRRDIDVGIMVEVPSTAVLADHFAREVDFFSLGTNDLTQYTLAVDRGNESVAELYSPVDPAVLRLVRHTISAAERRGVHVSICGEMCGDPLYTMLLIGLGIRSMSAPPHSLLEIKQVVRSVTVEECREVARRVFQMENARDIEVYLRQVARQKVPDLFE